MGESLRGDLGDDLVAEGLLVMCSPAPLPLLLALPLMVTLLALALGVGVDRWWGVWVWVMCFCEETPAPAPGVSRAPEGTLVPAKRSFFSNRAKDNQLVHCSRDISPRIAFNSCRRCYCRCRCIHVCVCA